jgi:hypothetical protein
MNDTDILYALDQACQGLNLIFQVVRETETLYIYINRPAEQAIQHEILSGTIQGAIATLELPHLKNLCLYSRALGTTDPDWETLIPLISTEVNATEANAIEPPFQKVTQETVAKESIKHSHEAFAASSERLEIEINPNIENTDFSQYCFTRNRALLTSDILPPTESIARLLQGFDVLLSSQKQEVLPLLDSCFRGNSFPSVDDLDSEAQAWLHQLAQMNPTDLRKTAIWISRYCLNPEVTMGQVTAILPLDKAVAPAAGCATTSPQSLTQATSSADPESSLSMYAAAAPVRPRVAQEPERTLPEPSLSQPLAREKIQPPLVRYAFLVPLIWLLCTATLIIIDVQAQMNPQVSEEFCKTAKSQPYCQLAVQLLGTEQIQRFQKDTATAPPMIEGVKEKSVTDCELKANFNAGFTLKDDRERSTVQNPVVNLQQETVFPGLFVVDIQHVGKTEGTVRTACVYHQTVDPVMLRERPSILAAEVIPTHWPTEPFENKTYRDTSQTFWTIPNLLRQIGTNTLFTAIGLLIAVYFGLGIEVDSLQTLYKSALFLGVSETITGFIPMFGFFRVTVLGVLSLMLTAVAIKDFRLDWSTGYKVIASGALVIIFVRALLQWLLFFAIISFVA